MSDTGRRYGSQTIPSILFISTLERWFTSADLTEGSAKHTNRITNPICDKMVNHFMTLTPVRPNTNSELIMMLDQNTRKNCAPSDGPTEEDLYSIRRLSTLFKACSPNS